MAEREARQKALAEKKRRLEEIKARRRQPASGGTTTKTDGGSSGLDSYIDDLLNTTAPGLKGLSAAADTTNAVSTTDVAAVSKEESKAATDIEKKEEESTSSSTENTATQPAPTQQQQPPQTPKVETFEIAIQCMEDDFPSPSLVDDDEEKEDEDDGDESSQDGSSAEDGEHEQRGQSTSSIMRTASYEDRTSTQQQTSDIPQPLLLSESEKEKLLSSQPFNTFLSTASKRVERLLGASDMNMYGILNGSGWGVTGTPSSGGLGDGVSGSGAVDFSVDYANDNEDDEEYYEDSDDELADGVSSATTAATRRKKRRSKKKTKEEAYQTGGYFNARATYEFPKFTHGRNVTDIEWCPGHKEWVLASYNAVSGSARDGLNENVGGEGKGTTKGMPSSSNPTTRHLNPLDPSSSFLQTSSSSAIPNEGIVAIYNLSMPSRPEHLFCAGCPILHSQFHPTEHPKLILGGGSSGQVLVWDSRVGRYPVQRSANAVTGGGHDCELVGMKVLGNDNTTGGGGGGAGGLSTSKLVTASSDGKVNYWAVSNLREPIEHVKVNANLSCLEVLHGNTNEGIVCGDERGGLHTILAGTGRDGSASNKRIIRTLHPGGVVVTDDENAMDDADNAAATELAEMGHYGMITSVATRPIMPPTGSTPRLGNKETTSGGGLGGSSKGFSRGAGGLMVTTGVDWSTKLWAPAYTDAPLMSFLSNSYDYMCDAQWSPVHPSIFATASSNGTVNIWNLASSLDQPVSGTEGIPIDNSNAGDSSSSSSGLNRLQWSSDGRRMAVASGDKLHVLGVGEEAWKSKGDEEGRTMGQLRSRGLIHEE